VKYNVKIDHYLRIAISHDPHFLSKLRILNTKILKYLKNIIVNDRHRRHKDIQL